MAASMKAGMNATERAAWSVIALLSVGVAGYALFLVVTGFRYLALENPMLAPWGLRTHIAASAFAMLLGPFQFLKKLRARRPRLHRWSGRVYVAACLVGGVAGATIALSSTAGLPAGAGFLLLALFWLATTSLAWVSAMRRDFAAHERWMVRSFALTFAAVTLRLYIPASVIANHGELAVDAYRVIAWACWVPNLVLAEIWLRTRNRRTASAQPSPAA